MPVSGEPLEPPVAVPAQVVMLLPVKLSMHGKLPPASPGHTQVLSHVPPKSPKLDAAGAIFLVVKLKSKPADVTCWHAPSISDGLTVSVQVITGPWPPGTICIIQEP